MKIDSPMDLVQSTAAITPAPESGYTRLYTKSDGGIYAYANPGTERIVGGLDTGWTALPYAANWGHYNAGYQIGQYKRANNMVFLRGTIKRLNSVSANSAIIATLPVGYRPTAQLILGGDATGNHVQFNIDISGNLTVFQVIQVNGDVTVPPYTFFWLD